MSDETITDEIIDEVTEEEIPADTTEEDLRHRLERIVKGNVAIEEDLIKQGVQPNPFIILSMRLDLLLDSIFQMGDRLTFEIESAKRVHDILMQIEQQVLDAKTRQKLILPEPTIGVPQGGFVTK
jgi:hypothetical protein